MADIAKKSSIKYLLESLRANWTSVIQADRKERFYSYAKLFFIFVSLFSGYQFLVYGCYWIIAGLLTHPSLTDLMGKPLGSDFIAFYAASKLALQGDPSGIYSIAKMHALQKLVIGTDGGLRPWHYPPSFLLIVLPLAIFPYVVSFVLWIFTTLYGYVRIVRRIAPHPLTPWVFLSFPPAINNFFYGQNGFFSTMLMGGGLLLLDYRPLMGGVILGLISYKPQMAMLIPVALLAGRNWRALIGAAISSICLAIISLLIFGTATWQAFLQNIPYATQILKCNEEYWNKMPTIFATARLLGAGLTFTEVLQTALALAAIGVVAWIWWNQASLPLRASSLIIATFLAAPFAFEYDLVLLALPFAWLGWREVTAGCWPGQCFLAAAWLSTFLSIWLPWLNLSLLTLLALLAFVLYRCITAGFGTKSAS